MAFNDDTSARSFSGLRRLLRSAAGPLSPPVKTFRHYRRADFPHDLLAGLTVSVVDLPQSMAFALIAGVPPVYGLYTAIFLAFFGALFTSSRYLSVGPTNTQSLLCAAVVSRLTHDPAVYLQLVLGLALVKGLMQLAFSAARMGRLVRYVSQSVMIGFTAGAGVLIFLEQLPGFLGVHVDRSVQVMPGLVGALQRISPLVAHTDPRAVVLAVATMVVVLGAPRLSRYAPGPLVAVAGAALTVHLAGWTHGDLALIGPLPRGLPGLGPPDLSLGQAESLLPGALALAVLGMLESVSIAKSIALRTGQRISADQEFFGQGIANLIGSMLSCMPGSGSFSRTALQHMSGARTRVASVLCAGFNAIFFLALAPLARDIPLAALAGILFVVAAHLIDLKNIRRLVRTSRADALVCLGTLACALFLPLTYALYVGIFLNIAAYLRESSRLRMVEMVAGEDDSRPFHERALGSAAGRRGEILFLQLQGSLFFGVADELADHLGEISRSPVAAVLLRLRRVNHIDANVLFALERFVRDMHARGGHVILCGVSPEVMGRLRGFGLLDLLGTDNVFPVSRGLMDGAKRALARARRLVDGQAQPSVTQGSP